MMPTCGSTGPITQFKDREQLTPREWICFGLKTAAEVQLRLQRSDSFLATFTTVAASALVAAAAPVAASTPVAAFTTVAAYTPVTASTPSATSTRVASHNIFILIMKKSCFCISWVGYNFHYKVFKTSFQWPGMIYLFGFYV